MDFLIENVIPMSAPELCSVLHTPGFDAFMAREYVLKVYFELEKIISNQMMQRRLRVVTTVSLNFITQWKYQKLTA
jgi:hypothetical protein